MIAKLTALGLGVAAALALLSGGPAEGAQRPPVAFDWEMPDRFGIDTDGDGRIEIENTAAYVHNRLPATCPDACPEPLFFVALSASPTAEDLGLAASAVSYRWVVSGPDGVTEHHEVRPGLDLLIREADYDVRLSVIVKVPWGRITRSTTGPMAVDDVLVVALGDSYASGEGNPDVPVSDGEGPLWADAGTPAVESQHAAAHRSAVAWPVRVALALEDESVRSSVSFVDLTATGARIDRGLLNERSEPPLPAQLTQLAEIVQERPIDVLLLQVGGNDVGFANVIRSLVAADPLLDPICYEVMVQNAWDSARDGDWDRGVRVTFSLPFDWRCRSTPGDGRGFPGLDGLETAFDRLAAELARFEIGRVVLVEYPNPTGGGADGERCDEVAGDVTSPFGFHEVDEWEQAEGVRRVLDPLNATLQSVAEARGWLFAGGVAESFADGHGYCAPWPDYGYPDWFEDAPLIADRRIEVPSGWYRPPGRYGGPLVLNDGPVSWYRTAAQSSRLQGPVPRFLTSGTLHPNELGHLAMTRIVLGTLAG